MGTWRFIILFSLFLHIFNSFHNKVFLNTLLNKGNFQASPLSYYKFEITGINIRALTLLKIFTKAPRPLNFTLPNSACLYSSSKQGELGSDRAILVLLLVKIWREAWEKGKRRYWARRWRATFESQRLFWWHPLLSASHFQTDLS